MTREKQFQLTAAARATLQRWATDEGIPLSRIEFVYPFVGSDFSLSVWLFYSTELDVVAGERDGTTNALQEKFRAAIRDAGYDPSLLDQVSFVVDSAENVDRNYEGSYFYRLR